MYLLLTNDSLHLCCLIMKPKQKDDCKCDNVHKALNKDSIFSDVFRHHAVYGNAISRAIKPIDCSLGCSKHEVWYESNGKSLNLNFKVAVDAKSAVPWIF